MPDDSLTSGSDEPADGAAGEAAGEFKRIAIVARDAAAGDALWHTIDQRLRHKDKIAVVRSGRGDADIVVHLLAAQDIDDRTADAIAQDAAALKFVVVPEDAENADAFARRAGAAVLPQASGLEMLGKTIARALRSGALPAQKAKPEKAQKEGKPSPEAVAARKAHNRATKAQARAVRKAQKLASPEIQAAKAERKTFKRNVDAKTGPGTAPPSKSKSAKTKTAAARPKPAAAPAAKGAKKTAKSPAKGSAKHTLPALPPEAVAAAKAARKAAKHQAKDRLKAARAAKPAKPKLSPQQAEAAKAARKAAKHQAKERAKAERAAKKQKPSLSAEEIEAAKAARKAAKQAAKARAKSAKEEKKNKKETPELTPQQIEAAKAARKAAKHAAKERERARKEERKKEKDKKAERQPQPSPQEIEAAKAARKAAKHDAKAREKAERAAKKPKAALSPEEIEAAKVARKAAKHAAKEREKSERAAKKPKATLSTEEIEAAKAARKAAKLAAKERDKSERTAKKQKPTLSSEEIEAEKAARKAAKHEAKAREKAERTAKKPKATLSPDDIEAEKAARKAAKHEAKAREKAERTAKKPKATLSPEDIEAEKAARKAAKHEAKAREKVERAAKKPKATLSPEEIEAAKAARKAAKHNAKEREKVERTAKKQKPTLSPEEIEAEKAARKAAKHAAKEREKAERAAKKQKPTLSPEEIEAAKAARKAAKHAAKEREKAERAAKKQKPTLSPEEAEAAEAARKAAKLAAKKRDKAAKNENKDKKEKPELSPEAAAAEKAARKMAKRQSKADVKAERVAARQADISPEALAAKAEKKAARAEARAERKAAQGTTRRRKARGDDDEAQDGSDKTRPLCLSILGASAAHAIELGDALTSLFRDNTAAIELAANDPGAHIVVHVFDDPADGAAQIASQAAAIRREAAKVRIFLERTAPAGDLDEVNRAIAGLAASFGGTVLRLRSKFRRFGSEDAALVAEDIFAVIAAEFPRRRFLPPPPRQAPDLAETRALAREALLSQLRWSGSTPPKSIWFAMNVEDTETFADSKIKAGSGDPVAFELPIDWTMAWEERRAAQVFKGLEFLVAPLAYWYAKANGSRSENIAAIDAALKTRGSSPNALLARASQILTDFIAKQTPGAAPDAWNYAAVERRARVALMYLLCARTALKRKIKINEAACSAVYGHLLDMLERLRADDFYEPCTVDGVQHDCLLIGLGLGLRGTAYGNALINDGLERLKTMQLDIGLSAEGVWHTDTYAMHCAVLSSLSQLLGDFPAADAALIEPIAAIAKKMTVFAEALLKSDGAPIAFDESKQLAYGNRLANHRRFIARAAAGGRQTPPRIPLRNRIIDTYVFREAQYFISHSTQKMEPGSSLAVVHAHQPSLADDDPGGVVLAFAHGDKDMLVRARPSDGEEDGAAPELDPALRNGYRVDGEGNEAPVEADSKGAHIVKSWRGQGWAAARSVEDNYAQARVTRTVLHLKAVHALIVVDQLEGGAAFDQFWNIGADFVPDGGLTFRSAASGALAMAFADAAPAEIVPRDDGSQVRRRLGSGLAAAILQWTDGPSPLSLTLEPGPQGFRAIASGKDFAVKVSAAGSELVCELA